MALAKNALARFREALGPKGFTDDAETIAPWLADWRGIYKGAAPALLSPANVSEVQHVINIARETNTVLVPQGGNTSMVGGAVPDASGNSLILSLRRMNTIRMLDSAANAVIAEAGVILSTLHEAAADKKKRFPLSLGAKGSATIGGLISTNAGGVQVLRFGTMRRLVLGLEAVLPNGQIFSSLSGLRKDNRGMDVAQLLIGSEGTLGIVTAARLQLFPAAPDRAVGWVGVKSAQNALKLLRLFEAKSGDSVESFEIMPDHCLNLVVEHVASTRRPLQAPHNWHVLVEVVQQGASARLEALLAEGMEAGLVEDAVIGASDAHANAFWRIRESISEAERAEGPAMQHDISIPVDAMPDFIDSACTAVEAKFPGVRARGFGHLGDGNVHFHVCAPAGVDGSTWRKGSGKEISSFVYDLVVAADGSISAEHGIGQMKLDDFVRTVDPARYAVLKAVKSAMDPQNIFNPGKLLPLASGSPAP